MALERVLLTGAGGFIGRWCVAPLLAAGYEVHAVAGRAARTPAVELSGAEIHHADLLDPSAVQSLAGRVHATHLLHHAWIATPGVYGHSPENARWLAAGLHLLRCFRAAGGRRAVMAGSCVEYDWSRVGVCVEATSPLADEGPARTTPYAQSKIAMQRALQRFGEETATSTAWGRIFYQYGPGEHPDRLVASVITRLLQGLEAPCTHGRQVRSFLHVADVGAAFAALLDSAVEGPVNIGSDAPLSLAGLVERIGSLIGRPELIQLGAREAPSTEPPLLLPDTTRLRREVGWSPRIGLTDGLNDTIGWWRSAG